MSDDALILLKNASLSVPEGAIVTGRNLYGGIQLEFQFPNGFGASVVRHQHSYGYESGLFELAVLDSEGNLCFGTEIASDVVGWLHNGDVDDYLKRISAL